MCPLVRTPNQCCVNKAIQHLSFDPSLQDSAWHKAQSRPKPYHTAEREKCSRKTEKGDIVCDASVLDVLDTLGISLDPTARSTVPNGKPPRKPESGPTQGIPNLDHLAHKSLYIPGKQSKPPTSCAEYLKRNPGANRVRMLAEIAACLQYLHSHKIIHGSIRPEALCVDDEGFPLLSYSPDDITPMNGFPDPYSAPELQHGAGRPRPTIQSDIYSFGSIVHWVCTGKHPHHTELAKLPLSMREQSAPGFQPTRPSRSLALNIEPVSSSLQPQLSSKQILAELTDYTLKSLVHQCRSTSPASRPLMLSIVLQLQQILVRHVLPTLPLPPLGTAPMTSSLSAYLPRARISATSPTDAISFNPLPSSTPNVIRTIALSPRPSSSSPSAPGARIHDSRAHGQNQSIQDSAYREGHPSELPPTLKPPSYFHPPLQSSKPHDGGQQAWQQSQQPPRSYRAQWDIESLFPFESRSKTYNSGSCTPTYDQLRPSRVDSAPKLAFDPLDSPIAPHAELWDVPHLISPYPSTAGLQPPPSETWAPSTSDGGANIHRNRTL